MTRIVVSMLGVLLPWGAYAHHSVGVFYETEASSEISGTITGVDWVNPHIRFTVESTNDAAEPVIWAVESGSVNMLERNGVGRGQLEVGSVVTVVGRPSRLGRQAVYATAIRTADDATVTFRGLFGEREAASAGFVADASSRPADIFRVWTAGRAYGQDADNSATGLTLPYTPVAQAARAHYNPLTDDTALRCIPQGMPGIMDNPFPIQFVKRGNDIVLRGEEWDIERTIHLSGGADPQTRPTSPLGYSVGRWEDETLVVTTTRIDWPFFDDVGTPQSTAMATVERFSLSADKTRLNYTITATDPTTFAQPVTLTGYWVWVPDQEIKPYNCTL